MRELAADGARGAGLPGYLNVNERVLPGRLTPGLTKVRCVSGVDGHDEIRPGRYDPSHKSVRKRAVWRYRVVLDAAPPERLGLRFAGVFSLSFVGHARVRV